jgi:hypothetical protein
VEDSHAPTLQVPISTIYRRNRLEEVMNRRAAVDAIFPRRRCALLTAQAGDRRGDPTVGRVSDGLRTISLANLIVLPRPLDTFVNTVPGPYVPGGKAEAPAFTVSVIVTPLVSVVPEVELAVSQEGVLIE